MNLTNLILGITLILFGLVYAGLLAIDSTVMGILLVVAGALVIASGYVGTLKR